MAAILAFPQRERATPAESAKALKQALQQRFPATHFSVRLGRGTGYGDCDVSWTDGPTRQLVETIVSPFEGQTFDGMTDMREYVPAYLPDGRRSSLKLISCQRNLSASLARKAAHQVATFYGVAEPVIVEHPDQKYVTWTLERDFCPREDIREYWSTLIHRAASDASTYRREDR